MKILKNKLFYEFIIVILIVIVGIYFLYDRDDQVKLKIGNEEYIFIKNETEKELNLITLNSEYDTIIKSIRNSESIKINNKKLILSKNLGKLKLDNSKIEISIKYKGDKKYTNYIINITPNDFPSFETKGESKTQGDFYLTTYSGANNLNSYNYIYKINNKGDLIFYRRVFKGTYIFKKELIDNKVYYSYIDYEDEKDVNSLNILDSKYNLIKTVYDVNKDEEINLNPHDYIVIDLNNFIFESSNEESEENALFTIHEVKNNEIVWEYTNDNYLNDIGEYKTFHFNSFYLDDDNNLLVSFRNTSEVLKINRKNGKLIWNINGNKNNLFSYQHSVLSHNGKYMLYNNNVISDSYEDNKQRKSEIVIFNYDNKITLEKKYELDTLSMIMGSVYPTDIENNTYVLSYGRTINQKNNFDEIDLENNKVYFSFKYLDDLGGTFRVYKF